MKTLIIGGTGLIGAETARLMNSHGHEVTLMSRNSPANPALSQYKHIAHDYIHDDISTDVLDKFDWLVFSQVLFPIISNFATSAAAIAALGNNN